MQGSNHTAAVSCLLAPKLPAIIFNACLLFYDIQDQLINPTLASLSGKGAEACALWASAPQSAELNLMSDAQRQNC